MKPTLSLSFLSISCLAALLAFGATAHADTYTFSATGSAFTGSGTLAAVADPTLSGALDVTSITGNINGTAITGLLPCATYDVNNPCTSTGTNSVTYDNVLYPAGGPLGLQYLDFRGIGFALASGIDGDFFASSTHQDTFITNVAHDNGRVVAFSISPTPEPGGMLLLGTGLLGMTGMIRRRLTS